MKRICKKQNGITLIALVITIIVLLILAGISIAMLTGENGILTKANIAKTEINKSAAEEEVKLEILGSYDSNGKFNYDTFKTNVENNLEATANDNGNRICKVTNKGYDVTINKTTGEVISMVKAGETATSTEKDNYYDGIITATIPEGFTVSNIEGEKTIKNGLVIYDIPERDLEKANLWTETNEDGTLKVQTDYNQFVWVPVDSSSEDEFNRVFKRTEGYYESEVYTWLLNCEEADANGVNIKITENTAIQIEAREMYASVKEYEGFYIGRYEAGIEGENKRTPGADINANVVIKKNKHVYNYIG